MAFTWLQMYREKGNYSKDQFIEELKRVCNLPEIKEAVNLTVENKSGRKGFREFLRDHKYDEIFGFIESGINQKGIRQKMKSIVVRLTR